MFLLNFPFQIPFQNPEPATFALFLDLGWFMKSSNKPFLWVPSRLGIRSFSISARSCCNTGPPIWSKLVSEGFPWTLGFGRASLLLGPVKNGASWVGFPGPFAFPSAVASELLEAWGHLDPLSAEDPQTWGLVGGQLSPEEAKWRFLLGEELENIQESQRSKKHFVSFCFVV